MLSEFRRELARGLPLSRGTFLQLRKRARAEAPAEPLEAAYAEMVGRRNARVTEECVNQSCGTRGVVRL